MVPVAGKLFMRLSSAALGAPVLLELSAAEAYGGQRLAAALARRWPGIAWHVAGQALEDVAQLPLDGRILLCDAPLTPDPGSRPGPGGHEPAVLVVMRGPDPGGTLPLHRGVYALGRGDVDLPIGDLGLSRRHALLRVTDTSILLSDEGSTNGVWLARTPILERRLLIGDSFGAGESTFAVLPARGLVPGPARWPLEPVPITEKEPGSRLAMMLIGALAPLALGLGLFLLTHSVYFLAFASISLLTGGLPALMVLRARARFRRAWAGATAVDAKRREDLAAPLGAVAAGLAGTAGGVAVDRTGFPALVIGTGRMAAWLGSGSNAEPPAPRLVRGRRQGAIRGRRRLSGPLPRFRPSCPDAGPLDPVNPGALGILPDSPVSLLLHPGATVWFRGQESGWGPVLRGVLVRWLPLLAAGSLQVVVLGPAGFLPAELAMLSGVRVISAGDPLTRAGSPTVVLGTEPDVIRQLRPDPQDPAQGDLTAWFQCGGPAPAGAEVHIDCQAQLLVLQPSGLGLNPWLRPAPQESGRSRRGAPGSADRASFPGRGRVQPPLPGPRREPALTGGNRENSLPVALEGIGFDTLARAVRRMLPIGAATAFPGPEPIMTPGHDAGHRLGTVIGDTAAGPLHLDLDADGPHLMVAGTTGSGKSELLRSLVLGLATHAGPDVLALMLVDFKGGATLAPLRRLPHVQNSVSDLDGAAGERILDLLGHELHRREVLLARHGATDHGDYLRHRSAIDPPLPKLVVVIDEFRVFATELPGALERVVHIATVGRSLGIHLVLSTQRPAGTISAPLRANIGSVIALRTVGEAESGDLIGSSAAARLDPAVPGMAYFRRAGEPPVKFLARVNSRPSVPTRLRGFGANLGGVLFDEELPADGPVAASPGGAAEGGPGRLGADAELFALVERIRERHRGVEPAPNPFSAALPDRLPSIPRSVLRQVPGNQGVVGMLDRPQLPQSAPLLFDPRATPRLLVCGLPGSGIEQVPALLVHAVNRRSFGMPALVLDGNGTLGGLRSHPAVSGYFGPGDPWRITELLLQLGDPACVKPVLLVVCGLGGWAEVLEGNAFLGLEALLARFARTVPGLGRALVVCGDRDLASSRAASLCETRWYFPRGAGPEVLMGWPQLRKVAPRMGRGVLLTADGPPRGTEFQLLEDTASMPLPPGPVPEDWLRSLPLPEVLSAGDIVPAVVPAADTATGGIRGAGHERAAAGPPPALAIGVGGPDNRPFIWSPGPCGLVIGHEGAGKRTLLKHLSALGGSEHGHTVHLGLDDELPTHAEEFLRMHPQVARVLVDRADLRAAQASRAAEVLLGARLQVILSAEPSARLLFELGLSAAVRDPRSFLVLDPQFGADAEPSGFRLPAASTSVRGRAMAIDRGTIRQIQCVNRTS